MITTKERARRFGVRLKTLFNIPEYHDFTYKVNGKTKRDKIFFRNNIPVKIPNFWYDPFELYVLAHIQRAHFIMTCNQWAYVDASVEYFDIQPRYTFYQRERNNKYKIEQFEKGNNEFAERVKKKDENTQTESDN
jgi:hypothetical protein